MAAYMIARIDVTDPQEYVKYAAQTVALAEKFGGEFLAKGGEQEQVEGTGAPSRHVIVRFPSRAAALEWYRSDAYQAILPIALGSSRRDVVIVDGVD